MKFTDRQIQLLETFDPKTRGVSLNRIPFDGFCWTCGEKIINKRFKRYCGKECQHRGEHFNWNVLRFIVAKRDMFKCVKCGISGDIYKTGNKKDILLEIDHIIEISTGETNIEKAKLCFDIDNCQTLCTVCHNKKTAQFLKARFRKQIDLSTKSLENWL